MTVDRSGGAISSAAVAVKINQPIMARAGANILENTSLLLAAPHRLSRTFGIRRVRLDDFFIHPVDKNR
jgi:hypothetical protein